MLHFAKFRNVVLFRRKVLRLQWVRVLEQVSGHGWGCRGQVTWSQVLFNEGPGKTFKEGKEKM